MGATFEDLEWLLDGGTPWEEAAERSGYKPDPRSMRDVLRRNGREDLLTRLPDLDPRGHKLGVRFT